MKSNIVKLGTRGSQLARWQTDHVASLLCGAFPDLKIRQVVISTRGDQVLDTPLPLVGGKGLFTAELEASLRSGDIDFAVHSLKDLPTDDPDGLTIGAIPQRADPADVLVSRSGYTLDTLPQGAVIGTSSTRRAAQLRNFRPDLQMHDIRGNINTRVKKGLDSDGPYDAIVLAKAGLSRLGMGDFISQILPFDIMLPAPGQGALGVQCRDDEQSLSILGQIQHAPTTTEVTAERAFLAALGGGCSVPVAAYALKQVDGSYLLTGRVSSPDGQSQITVEIIFAPDDAAQAGATLAQNAIAQGADALLGTAL
ncbi:MAG: hydroxymethylbilane synthase [Anaerolineaceae bacterium]|nr:hydroxymethylbilane synthase [Anaerolineaceae bacterium]